MQLDKSIINRDRVYLPNNINSNIDLQKRVIHHIVMIGIRSINNHGEFQKSLILNHDSNHIVYRIKFILQDKSHHTLVYDYKGIETILFTTNILEDLTRELNYITKLQIQLLPPLPNRLEGYIYITVKDKEK